MDLNGVTQIISSVGFPIVMSLLFFFYVRDTQAEMTKAVQDLKASIDRLYEMVDKISQKEDKNDT